jgi:hypothetical protein
MSYKEYCKWLAVGLFGFMGLSWDAMFFVAILLGNGTVTIVENNALLCWMELSCLSLLAIFVLIITIKHIADRRKSHV